MTKRIENINNHQIRNPRHQICNKDSNKNLAISGNRVCKEMLRVTHSFQIDQKDKIPCSFYSFEKKPENKAATRWRYCENYPIRKVNQ